MDGKLKLHIPFILKTKNLMEVFICYDSNYKQHIMTSRHLPGTPILPLYNNEGYLSDVIYYDFIVKGI